MKVAAWALCKDGEIIEIFLTEMGGKRALTRFTSREPAKEKRRWRVVRLKCLFDELENTDAV